MEKFDWIESCRSVLIVVQGIQVGHLSALVYTFALTALQSTVTLVSM